MTNKMRNTSTNVDGEIFVGKIDVEEKQKFTTYKKKHKQTPQQKSQESEPLATNLSTIFEAIFIILLKTLSQLVLKLSGMFNYVMNDFNASQFVDMVGKWCVEHPFTFVCVVIGGCCTFLPFLLLILFGLSAITMTLAGFLVLEGTLLTLVSMILIGFVGALIWFFISFGILSGALYIGCTNVYGWYSDRERIKRTLINLLQNGRVRAISISEQR